MIKIVIRLISKLRVILSLTFWKAYRQAMQIEAVSRKKVLNQC